nr:retrotransposon protein, putative, Ty1-copia subclass [Tanacetum cinerariifolium]
MHYTKERNYMNLIDCTLQRYLRDHIPIQSFDLDIMIADSMSTFLLGKWIQSIAIKSCLKELNLTIFCYSNGSYAFPDEIFSRENLDTIRVKVDAISSHRMSNNLVIKSHAAWFKGKKGYCCTHAYDHENMFSQQVEQELLETVRDFHACKEEKRWSVSSYVLEKCTYSSCDKSRQGPEEKNKNPQLAARGNNKGKKTSKLAYAHKPKIPPPPKKEDPAKDSIWTRKSRKLKPGALSLCIGNGSHAAVKAIGSFHLKMARKSYSHQVEKAKDLLGLIHTDVNGIIAHHTSPYTPQHNGVSEKRNRTLLDMVRSILSQITLLKSFWDYALESTACILNMVPTKKVEKTPYEVWSVRTRHVLDRMCLNIKVDKYELGDLNELTNNKVALLDHESDKWLNAMNEQMALQKKIDMDGAVHTYKARLVAKGFTETPGIDYEETFYHVADIRAIRGIHEATRGSKISKPKAEYIAASDTSKKAVWVRKFIYRLGVVPKTKEPIKMYCDNTRAITIANKSGIIKGARYYHAKVHYL